MRASCFGLSEPDPVHTDTFFTDDTLVQARSNRVSLTLFSLEAGLFHFDNECFPMGFAFFLCVKKHLLDVPVRQLNVEREPRSALAGSRVRGVHWVVPSCNGHNVAKIELFIAYTVHCFPLPNLWTKLIERIADALVSLSHAFSRADDCVFFVAHKNDPNLVSARPVVHSLHPRNKTDMSGVNEHVAAKWNDHRILS